MLQLENKTPFAARLLFTPNEHGVDTGYLIVRATFRIGKKWTLLPEQPDPVEADMHYGEPEFTSIEYASDLHIGKPATDIVMNGSAFSPYGKPVSQMDVSLRVGGLSKTVRVFGNRQWLEGGMSAPEPFRSMPLVYEKAFGGVDIVDGEVLAAEQRNPIGMGFRGERANTDMIGQVLPNLEDPRSLIRTPADTPIPAGFGFLSPGWEPRMNYVGTYDKAWQTQRAPFLPHDFDKRFLNMAHPDLIFPGYLTGGEEVVINGMHPDGDIQFQLPTVLMQSTFQLADKSVKAGLNLETVLIEPNQMLLSMVWRSSIPCDKRLLKLNKVTVSLLRST
jgi:hypothetical protein